MNVEVKTEVAQFPEKGYINRIFVAVYVGVYINPSYLLILHIL